VGIVCFSSGAVNAADRTSEQAAGHFTHVGAALGRSSFGTKDIGLPKTSRDERDCATKLHDGYRFTDAWRVAAGHVRLASVKETLATGNGNVTQTASARSLYLAATGRLPLPNSFALNGKAGLSFGKVSGRNVLPASEDITGSKRSYI
jgi:OOP family OmpA-OmpF porin